MTPRPVPRLASLLATLAVLGMAGCTTLSVKSNPPGARVVWSPDGNEPFREWPPRAFDSGAKDKPRTTPMSHWGRYGDAIFVTVEKEGYRRPLPQVAQLYTFKRNRLAFELEELPESVAARETAAGRVLWRGKWVDPAAEGLAVFEGEVMPRAEAERREMASKGLVPYEGAWVTPQERERRYAERMTAEGKVESKGRYVSPETARTEAALDAQVNAIAESGEFLNLPLPKNLGRVESGLAQVQVLNNSSTPSTIVFSGPTSWRLDLDAYQSWGINPGESLQLMEGLYTVAVIPREGEADAPASSATRVRESATPGPVVQLGSARLASGFSYSYSITGGTPLTPESLSAYELPKVTLPVDRKDIAVPNIDEIKAETTAPPPTGANSGRAPTGGQQGGRPPGSRPPGQGGRPAGGGQGGGRPRGPN